MPKIAIPALSFRPVVVGLMAVAVGLPMAFISLSKALVLLFVVGGAFCLFRGRTPLAPLKAPATPAAIAIALMALAVSVSWSEAPLNPLLLLIRSLQEARITLMSFVAVQTALLLGSWLLWAGVPIPWATSNQALAEYAVFSSRLDQPVMCSVTAAICWPSR